MKKQLLLLVMMMLPLMASAHDIEVQNADGVTIYYNYINESKELAVTYRGSYSNTFPNEYTGNIVIPEFVNYNNITYSVTRIDDAAFLDCYGLTSITIPNSVTWIGDRAFYGCAYLVSVAIGNGVTSLGDYTFYNCNSLSSANIPNSVTWIGERVFYNCI